jgi:TonB family protein
MKFLTALFLLISAHVSAQTIDCQVFEKLSTRQSHQKQTMRMTSVSTTKYGTHETLTETDIAGNRRMITKMPKMAGSGSTEYENLTIKGVLYSKNSRDTIWRYKKMSTPDTSNFASLLSSKPKYEQCRKVGLETIEGINYTIIETSIEMKTLSQNLNAVRFWINEQDSSIKKMAVEQQIKEGHQMTMVIDYGVAVSAIEKPQNAVPDTAKFKGFDRIAPYKSTDKRVSTLTEKENPEYKDGFKALFTFLNTNLIYPKSAREAKTEGTVYLRFMVETDGLVSEIKVAKGINADCDQAAVDLIRKTSGNWLPALSDGKPIRSTFMMPVKFKL